MNTRACYFFASLRFEFRWSDHWHLMRRLNASTLAIASAMFLTGCMSTGPAVNYDFNRIEKLSALDGVYKNKGDPNGLLSATIWPGKTAGVSLPHSDIDFVEVNSTENTLVAKAIKNECIFHEQRYVLGQDFKIDDGNIVIVTDFRALTRGPGDVMVGPSYQKMILGIDTRGNGKSKDSFRAAGLIFMIFPIAFSGTTEIKFERTLIATNTFKTCAQE